MGLFDKIKKTIDQSMAGFTGEGPSEEALASLTPEQRAAYDAQMARVAEAQAQVAGEHHKRRLDHEAKVSGRALRGPAGEASYGSAEFAEPDPEAIMRMSAAEQMEWAAQQSKAQFAELASNPFGRRKKPTPTSPDGTPAPPDPRPPAQIAAEERAVRDAARVPYAVAQRWPVKFSRITTTGKTQVEEVAAWLGTSGLAGNADSVYGLYRVPDRIDPTRGGGEKKRVVEWEVVHAATEALPAAPPAATVAFDGEDRWVARAPGHQSVLDEDLAVAHLLRAGIGPEQTIGAARRVGITQISSGGDDGDASAWLWARVEGVVNFVDPDAAAAAASAAQQMTAEKPLPVGFGAPDGVHVEVLNWGAIRRVVHPDNDRGPECPSPFPHLPSTPQELLQAYVEVLGLWPGDCYAAEVTMDRPEDLMVERHRAGGLVTYRTNRAEARPCADGEMRPRLSGGTLVVVAYRDRPEYAQRRERWVAYMDEVYDGDLRNDTGARRPVSDPPRTEGRGMRAVLKVADVLDTLTDGTADGPPPEGPHRYCWPPVVT